MTRRVVPFDRSTARHTLRFGEFEARVTDADLAHLHDTLKRLHSYHDPTTARLRGQIRDLLEDDGETSLGVDFEAARKVQLAVYADQAARRPISPALAEARKQAFRYIESQPDSADLA